MTDVAILLPTAICVKSVYDKLKDLGGNYELKYDDKENFKNSKNSLNFTTFNPKAMTYHSAKGLQFETVFLPYIEKFSGQESDRKALYVAMTRTYRNLYVMYSSALPSPLSIIDHKLYKTTEIDQIVDL
jgi:superfamily I DNA/RNA helicase